MPETMNNRNSKGLSFEEYQEKSTQNPKITVSDSISLFGLSSDLASYSEEIYDMLLSHLQRIEREKGMGGCVSLLLDVLKQPPKTEVQYAQINSVLEIVIAKAKQYEEKWMPKGLEEPKPKLEPTPEKTAKPDLSTETLKQPSLIIRPNRFNLRKLARKRREMRLQAEKMQKAAEAEEPESEKAAKTLEEVLQLGSTGLIPLLLDTAAGIDLFKLFSGDWESFPAPNLQIDFLGLFYTYLEMHVTLSLIFDREIVEADRIKDLSQANYKVFLQLFAGAFVEELMTELVVSFNLSMCLSLLLKGSALQDCYALFSQEGINLFSERSILGLQSSVFKVLGLLYYKEKNETILDIVLSFFTTQCLDAYTILQRKSIIESAVDALAKSVAEETIFQLIKKVMYAYESAAQYSESIAQMISIFLSCIKTKSKDKIREINGFFTKIIARSPNKIEHIESYCKFLSAHEIDVPLHHLVRRYDPQFIATFYSTYFRHPFTLEKGTKAVGDFINFVNSSDNLTYIYIMNMVPFIPTSPFIIHKLFLIYKRIYANASVFPRGIETEFLLLRMKTPALVGIAGFIFSDPKPLLKKRVCQKLAESVKISKSFNEDYIVFMALLYSIERAKLENYNYKGILSYLKDEITLKYLEKHLLQILKMVHQEVSLESKDFTRTYACELLQIAASNTAYPLSLRIIAEILQILFEKEPSIVFSEELHIRFREAFDTFRTREFSLYRTKDIFQMFSVLYGAILKKLKEEVIEAYNYVVLNIVDLGLFHALPVMRDERGIKELLDRSNLIMQAIREFPSTIMQGTEIWEWLYSLCVCRPLPRGVAASTPSTAQKTPLTEEEYNHLLYIINTEWIGDLITLRGDVPGIIENARNYLRWILSEEYFLETLMVLLRVSNREEKKELLKRAVLKGYSAREDTSVYYELYKAAKGTFYEYPLSQTYNFLSALEGSKKYLKPRELREQELYELEIDELVFLSTEYNLKKVAAVLMKKQIVCCCGFFLDANNLSVIEALSVIANSEDEQEIGKAFSRLEKEESDSGPGLVFYVPQIVQLLRKTFRKNSAEIKTALLRIVKNKTAHAIIWEIKAQGQAGLEEYENLIMQEMEPEAREQYSKVATFLQNFADVSGRLKQYVSLDRDRKKAMINQEISQVTFPEGCYLPITGETVIRVVEGSGKALQSAEKVPYMVTFKVQRQNSDEIIDRSVIFKFGDDCRQDVLALQIIRLFQEIFEEKGLSVYLYPYKVLATGDGCGIIEVIPKAVSRDQIGRERVNNLVDYFALKYGYREGHKYVEALKNFVESFAGYSLVTYILNIKDRHNGNIMISDDGHLIHIDFGFMFDISPGNINIESPIKITDEIFSLLGGAEGEAFALYKDLMIRGFYLLRKKARDIILMVDLGRHGGLPCYTSATMSNLISRFRLDLKDHEIPEFVKNLIGSSTKKLRTWIYDQYQHLTNNIAF
ncbi:phosphatidylinositol 4-kinase A [Nematocida homosporus]|uniref:phosphatidylinositol 4-kinase A n=1 Tax=Nematocida homosporus TaxID=1912981 RepID=UPI00221F62E7|nr:phosphatidylinositol 4-kinase A [Nematocida homosporus]KAI5184801.1 phosphatidylinositol 4-kinase A [Nematocida homosporus]